MINFDTIRDGILDNNDWVEESQVTKYLIGLLIFFGTLCFPAYELFFKIAGSQIIGLLAIILVIFLGVSVMDYSSKDSAVFEFLFRPFVLYVVFGVVFVGIGYWIKLFF